jgi:hypothetical protein
MKKITAVFFIGVVLFGGTAGATLFDRGGGLIYDDALDSS